MQRARGARAVFLAACVAGVALAWGAVSCHKTTRFREDAGPDADTDVGVDADGDGDGDDDADNPCLPDPDSDVEADTEVDADPGPDVETDVEVDADPDLDVDLDDCPDDMAPAGTVCIDIYEASRTDATRTSQGTATDRAWSRPDVMPWSENPLTDEGVARFAAACEAAGKRLCTADEWAGACRGPAGTLYVYGATFDREICNCVDTYCDDYCDAHPEVDPCDLGANCGYTYYTFHAMPTASFPLCTNELGTWDMNGNVWEIVLSETDTYGRGYEIRGGAFNCASAEARVTCAFNASWSTLYAGFRCCLDRLPPDDPDAGD